MVSVSGDDKNARWFEVDKAFRSQVLHLTDGLPHILYSETTTPAKQAGKLVYIYVITVFSHFGNTIGEVVLEQPVATEIYPRIAVNSEETAVVCLGTPLPVGITGVYARAYRGGTLQGLDISILGLEV